MCLAFYDSRCFEKVLGLRFAASAAARGHRHDFFGPRFSDCLADRRRQIALLSITGDVHAGSRRCCIATDRSDEESSRCLRELGIPAAAIHSGQGERERRSAANQVAAGKLRLLYLAPERLLTERTIGFLNQQPLQFIAIDEAHCISSWGHDFRPEYRELRVLRDAFPKRCRPRLHRNSHTSGP